MMHPRGLTTIELLVTLGVLSSIFALSAYSLSKLQRSFAAQSVDREIAMIFTTAARHARHGVQGTSWGVYIPYDATTRQATSVIMFSGNSYATRNTAYDRTFMVNDDAQFTYVDFSGAAADTGNDREIVFSYLSGATSQYGSITVSWYGQTRTMTIDADGLPVRQ